MYYALRLARKGKAKTALETAKEADRYLTERTYYRFLNEIMAVGGHWFKSVEVETRQLMKAKADLMVGKGGLIKKNLGRVLDKPGRVGEFLVTHFFNAAFCIHHPQKKMWL